jgi:RND family efflux transporter MFP subunit
MESVRDNLSKLTIAREQRPTQRRSWLGLVVIAAVVGLLVAAASWWYARTTGLQAVASLTGPVLEVDLMEIPQPAHPGQQVSLVATGKIVSDVQVKIATKVSGQIVELAVEQGQKVAAGQVLARVEDEVYRAQRDQFAAQVRRQQHAIEASRAQVAFAEARVIELRANCEFEARNFQRLQRLNENGQIDDLEYDNGKNKHEMAQAALEQAVAAIGSAQANVQLAEAELAATQALLAVSQKRLDDCAITSPLDGVVLERNAQIGDFLAAEGGRGANANAQLVEIADMTLLRVEVDVSERDVGRLSPDQPARITPDASREHHYDGRVLWIDPLGDYARATVQVKVRILDPGPDLRIGGSAKVEFFEVQVAASSAEGQASAIWLPKAAVRIPPEGDQATIFTVENDRAVAHTVTLGARTLRTVEVRDGAAPGMRIIASAVGEVQHGRAVRVRGMRQME